MSKHVSLSSNWLSSSRWYRQVLGALISSKVVTAVLLVAVGIVVALLCLQKWKLCVFVTATVLFGAGWHVVNTLTPVFCLRKEEGRITWCQIFLLLFFGLWLASLLYSLSPIQGTAQSIVLTSVGILLGWMFQDTIKSVVAFFYLRTNGLLNIDDWIVVPEHNIDGVVKNISLTTVTLTNWDTTTSSFPTYIIHAEHFKNNQQMRAGKTEGRLMSMTFVIDTGWIHVMSRNELDNIRAIIAQQDDDLEHFISHEAKAGMLNIQLYRMYIYHWLMHHPHVSQTPRLIVRWLEQRPEGMPLQLYAFITDSDFAQFEWQQSLIMEHAIESLAWFNLQLYQSASGFDASNSNIYLSKEPAIYKKGQSNGHI